MTCDKCKYFMPLGAEGACLDTPPEGKLMLNFTVKSNKKCYK